MAATRSGYAKNMWQYLVDRGVICCIWGQILLPSAGGRTLLSNYSLSLDIMLDFHHARHVFERFALDKPKWTNLVTQRTSVLNHIEEGIDIMSGLVGWSSGCRMNEKALFAISMSDFKGVG